MSTIEYLFIGLGCMCFACVGTLTHVEGNINAQKYINIIYNNLWPVIARHFLTENLYLHGLQCPV